MTKQNKSHAVMAQRHEKKDSLDDFPTPPWATRALCKYVINKHNISRMSCLEPACNRGYMSTVLEESFKSVTSSDIYDYGFGIKKNFLLSDYKKNSFDWVITNPPFNLAEDFFFKADKICKVGVALLVRTVFLESIGRYKNIFLRHPPSKFAQFSERVPMIKGKLDRKASTATGYAWIVWEKNVKTKSKLVWIPPCRSKLERNEDYSKLSKPIKKTKKTIIKKTKPRKQLTFLEEDI